MAIAPVASTSAASGNDNDVTTPAINTSGATLLVVVESFYALVTEPALTDSQGNTWTPLTKYAGGAGASQSVARISYIENPSTSAAHTFTATGTGSYPAIAVLALSGTKASAAFDSENGLASNTAVFSMQVGSVTPSEDNCIVISAIAFAAVVTASLDGGFTEANNGEQTGGAHNYGVDLAYLIQTTAAAADPTWTFSGSTGVAGTNAVFKAAAVGGGGGIVRQMMQHHHYRGPRRQPAWRKSESGIYMRAA